MTVVRTATGKEFECDFMGIATGAGILSAQYFGAHDRRELSRTVGNTLLLVLGSGLLMSILGVAFSPLLVGLTNPPEEVAAGAVIYLQIIFIQDPQDRISGRLSFAGRDSDLLIQ